MIFLLIVSFLIIFVIGREYQRKSSLRWKKLQAFPGDKPLPLIGNSLQLGFDSDEVSQKLMAMWERHGKQNFRVSVGSEDWIMISDPDDVGALLNHPSELSKPLERNTAIKPFFGNSVSSSDGERWKSTRKLMTPSFHFKTLEKRVMDINNHCDNLFNILDVFQGRSSVNLYTYLRPYMFDILCSTLMGVDSNFLNNLDHPYLEANGEVVNIITQNYFSYWRNIPTFFKISPQYRRMMKTVKTIIDTSTAILNQRKKILNKIKEAMDPDHKSSDIEIVTLLNKKADDDGCMLDKFLLNKLSNGNPIPDDIIEEEISLICFTGHYTTTLTICHTLYYVAKYPEIQNRIIEEQQCIFKNDMSKKPTHKNLNDMKYLEAVIKESMRVLPPVTKIGRQLKKDFRFDDGRIAPAGSSVIVFFEAMYQNPNIFPEPEKFDPERFFNSMHLFSFVPFSAGPRNCLGFRYAWVAMKATLSNMLRRYEVVPCDPADEPQFAYRILTESKNGIHLKLKKRYFN
uniref:Cytochrome P450 CYP405A7 n=1 Tax=Danaus plexippus TaxID=13037 RepID=A0A2Z6JIR8_DANPL|nr:cytochrome P450 4d2-like [Danaus plexippus plexippus]DAB41764.1 TPA_inf: cytochrome P450 CYP405A7 [Danaus plexippus]